MMIQDLTFIKRSLTVPNLETYISHVLHGNKCNLSKCALLFYYQ